MKFSLLTYLLLATLLIQAQDSRDFHGSNTYFEVTTLNDSIYNLYKSKDVLLDSQSPTLSLSINDSLIQFTNQLDKSDEKIFTHGTYSIRVKTNGYHFECRDKINYLYAVDGLKLVNINEFTVSLEGSYKIFRVKKKKKTLASVENVIIKLDKDDVQGVLFGDKYTYDPKATLKTAKRKDIVKFTALSIATVFVGGVVFIYRAVLFPSIF